MNCKALGHVSGALEVETGWAAVVCHVTRTPLLSVTAGSLTIAAAAIVSLIVSVLAGSQL